MAAPPEILAARLLAWYREHARALPWRNEPTPYRVLLSELMLQQTRVETALPYFEAFTRQWPTIEALAAADEEEVVRAWSGLGYYRRARHLHRAARQAVAAGGLPADAAALRELPGVGPYTAGAVASIAFGLPEPAVDGNVERVLSRVDGRADDPRTSRGRRALEVRARALLDPAPPSELNQALMELGALVCTPRRPSCEACPWREVCVARAQGLQASLPTRPPRRPPRPIPGVAALIRTGEGVVLARRPQGGLLGGLWEPPGGEPAAGETPEDALVRLLDERLGLALLPGRRLGEVVHVFTHRRLTLTVLEGTIAPTAPLRPRRWYQEVRAADPHDPGLALSTLARRTLALLPA